MKLSIRTIVFSVAIAALCMPTADARGRNNADNRNQHIEKRNDNNGNRRPGQTSRPNNNHNNGNRPANNHPNYGRPNQGNHNHRPPQNSMSHGTHHKQPNHHFAPTPPPPPLARPPHRPHMPAHRPWHRPTPPPPAFRPAPGWTPSNTILGITLGSAINISVNALINSGYNVTGYGNDAVYVTNAAMLNMLWPDATLFYNNGGLYASEFVYSTPTYNMSRYNATYRALVRNYGNPVSSTNAGGVITTTWWGPGGQFINLSFQNAIAGNGAVRFFTTLSFGN